jgi:quercetin dioxygenase-like cupin family protein
VDERCLKEGLMPAPTHAQRVSILVAGEETGGRFALVEMVEERGAEPPRHLHHWEDETLYVLEGSLSVWVAGRWVEAPVGAAVFLERGVEHALAVAAEGARVLSFFAPAGFEGFYRELGATSAPDVERHVATAARYGCEIVGPAPKRARGGGTLPGMTTRAAARVGETQEVRAGTEE